MTREPRVVHLLADNERLRADNERLQAERDEWKATASAEIERLTRDLEIWKRNGGDILLRAEIERLTIYNAWAANKIEQQAVEIERLQSLADDMGQTNIINQIEIERLQAEIVTERWMEADAWCNQLNVEIEQLHVKLEACMQETSALRDGVTKAIGMEWYGKPGEARVCPDDKKIIAACERLKGKP